jgi:hypothetical protein
MEPLLKHYHSELLPETELFIQKSQYTAADEGRNNIRAKSGTVVYVASEGQIIQPPAIIVGQVESERSTSVLYILSRQNYALKFHRC